MPLSAASPPRLSVVLPSYSAGAVLTRRTLESYGGQTDLDGFEVLLVDDGGVDDQIRQLAERSWPFALRYLISPRVKDVSVAHKNHARNRGARAARGDLLFLVDADCLVPPDFVARVREVYARISADGQVVAAYPLIANLHARFTEWIAQRGDDALRTRFDECLADVGRGDDAFAGYMELRGTDAAGYRAIRQHAEGFPIVPRRLFDLLGGFDEDFLGWGGNKQEFQQRVNEAPEIATFLLTSCVVFHQPHPKSADNRKVRGNDALMQRKQVERTISTEWATRRKRLVGQAPVDIALRHVIGAGGADLEQLAPDAASRCIVRVTSSGRLAGDRIRVAGPWVGEFGWQVARWQGGVRRRQLADPDAHLVVVGDPGGEGLYEQADEYWWTPAFIGALGMTRDMTGWKDERGPAAERALLACVATELTRVHPHAQIEWLRPRRFEPREQEHRRLVPPAWAELERAMLTRRWPDDARWACLFPRQRALNPQKNWPASEWQDLARHVFGEYGLYSVVLGGDGDSAPLALDPATSVDLTRIPLERRLGLGLAFLARAALAIGSESGGSQLALMAGTPTVVLGSPPYEQRVTIDENPLETACEYVSEPRYQHAQVAVRDAVARLVHTQAARGRVSTAPGDASDAPRVVDVPPATPGQVPPQRHAGRADAVLPLAKAASERVIATLRGLPEVERTDRQKDWFTSEDYYPVFGGVAAATQPRRVLEVGVRLGYSLVAMWSSSPTTVTRIVGVDDESAIPGSQSRARANLLASGYAGEHELLVGDRRQTLEALRAHERFDLVHLDADVTEDATRQAIEQAWKLLAPGGVLLVDDVEFHPEVGRAFAQMRHELVGVDEAQRLPSLRGLGILFKRTLPVPEAGDAAGCGICGTLCVGHGGTPDARVVRCPHCDLVQVDFSDDAFRRSWQGLYRQDGRYHREHQVAGHASVVARYLHDRQLARLRVENLRRFAIAGRLFDVGCSNGALVKAATEAGFDAVGFDADAWVVELAGRLTGCAMRTGELLEFQDGPFDVITAIDVFEHFPTPIEHLAKLGSLLTATGLLVIEMPDADEPGFQRLGTEWRHFKPREHAFYYGARHVRALFQREGWTLVDSYLPYPDRRTYYARPPKR